MQGYITIAFIIASIAFFGVLIYEALRKPRKQ